MQAALLPQGTQAKTNVIQPKNMVLWLVCVVIGLVCCFWVDSISCSMLWPSRWCSICRRAVTDCAKTISLARMVHSRQADLNFGTLQTKAPPICCSNGKCFTAIAFIVVKWQACKIEQRPKLQYQAARPTSPLCKG